MAMNEEMTVAVSDSHTAVMDGDTVVVKEAVEMPPSRLWDADASSPGQMPGGGGSKPKGWLETQESKDFEPFLIMELKRIKPPNACARSHNEAERSLGQYKRLNSRISKALQSDDDGVLDIGNIDGLRETVERSIDALERMLEAHQDMKRQRRQVRRRRASDDSLCPKCAAPLWEVEIEGNTASMAYCLACEDKLVKEAGTPIFNGYQIHASAFEHAVTSMLINAVVSGGRDLEELYGKLKKKYGFTDREELAVLQIMEDKGYPVFKDRARLGESQDPADPGEPREWQSQYYA
jgi:hypothetical protein